MKMRRTAILLALFLVGQDGKGSVRQISESRKDPRSQELLKVGCSSLLGKREITLFGNGTLRLRRWQDGETTLDLAELAPDELKGYVKSLSAETAQQPATPRRGPGGEWVEQCELIVDVEPNPRREFRFGRMDALSLELSRLVAIGDELFSEIEIRRVSDAFPMDYVPRIGDVVLRADGTEFEIRRFTGDGRGVELQAVNQPLVLYVAKNDLSQEFAGLVRRRR